MNKFLVFIIVLLIIGVIAGTAVSLISKQAVPGTGLEPLEKPEDWTSSVAYGKDSAFFQIGKLRIFTREDRSHKKALLVVTPWLQYKQKDDRVFFEELDRNLQKMKKIVYTYFSTKTEEELEGKTEETIKQELVDEINEILVLGKIDAVYFNDYQFLKN